MKRYFLLLLMCVFTRSLFAQFLVESNGNVAVKPTSDPVVSYFSINHPGATDKGEFYIENGVLDIRHY